MNNKTIRIYRCGDGVYSAKPRAGLHQGVGAGARAERDTLFVSKEGAVRAAKAEQARRRIELAMEERKRRRNR
jgi:hypothetical protein